jgi:hypothetical protein
MVTTANYTGIVLNISDEPGLLVRKINNLTFLNVNPYNLTWRLASILRAKSDRVADKSLHCYLECLLFVHL